MLLTEVKQSSSSRKEGCNWLDTQRQNKRLINRNRGRGKTTEADTIRTGSTVVFALVTISFTLNLM